jgi:hypothetical protein
MKKTVIILAISFSAFCFRITGYGQSKSYQTLKDNFIGRPEVHSFSVNGFFSRIVLGFAGEWEFKEAIKEVQHIRLITIPTKEFIEQELSVNGFRKVLLRDSFEELANIRDNGDDITFFLQSTGKRDRYILLIQEPDEVVVIEVKGTIDINFLIEKENSLAFQKR